MKLTCPRCGEELVWRAVTGRSICTTTYRFDERGYVDDARVVSCEHDDPGVEMTISGGYYCLDCEEYVEELDVDCVDEEGNRVRRPAWMEGD